MFTHEPPRLTVLVVSLLASVSLTSADWIVSRDAHALAFTPAEQTCRDTFAVSGIKLAQIVAGVLSDCHRDRLAGKRSSSTDCNTVSEADTTSSVSSSSSSLAQRVATRCAGLNPALLHYTACPAPCDTAVPQIDSFSAAAACLSCVLTDAGETLSGATAGTPNAPQQDAEGVCHAQLDMQRDKVLRTLLRERRRCERAAERVGVTSAQGCSTADPRGKIFAARSRAHGSIIAACGSADLTQVASCSTASATELADCVLEAADEQGTTMFLSLYGLPPNAPTSTTTSTTSTTTTLPPQDPSCPATSALTLRGAVGESCTTNADCVAGTCDIALGRCRTSTELDTGWTGVSHDSDVVDGTVIRTFLRCGGPFNASSSEPCGMCYVLGIDPAGGSCRCHDDNRAICDQPFQGDATHCGGGMCDCYLGPPLDLSAGNTPVCVVNRFAKDVSGTVNVDTGETLGDAPLGSVVYLGETLAQPCPVCGGTCTAPAGKVGQVCGENLDCDSSAAAGDGVCGNYDPVIGDGVRGGKCYTGENAGLACDIDAVNTSFPAPQGGGHSLDCFPSHGKNVSGTGLSIDLRQTTNSVSMPSQLLCGYPPSISLSCPCGLCTGNQTVPCHSDADCSHAGGTCARLGGGTPLPNQCNDGVCTPTGGGEGRCNANPPDKFCDAITRADGEGFISCQGNADCSASNIGLAAGLCTLTKPRECFPDPITADGAADPQKPLGVSVFCIPPTASPSINAVSGLPGPGRAVNQNTTRAFCASDPNVEYAPGAGNCP